MRLPQFRLQTLFLLVLLAASILVSVESLMTHRREQKALSQVRGLQKLFDTIEPEIKRRDRDHRIAMDLAKKHGFDQELIYAIVMANEEEQRANGKSPAKAQP